MNYVGIDLHKKTIVLCVLNQDRKVVHRRTFACADTEAILAFFRGLGPFRAVVEATASYEWLVELIEPLAEKVVLANPGKLRVIAESDQEDRQARRLGAGRVPGPRHDPRGLPAHPAAARAPHAGPPPPVPQAGATALKNKMRRIVSDYNADRKDLFTAVGWQTAFKGVELRDGDRFVLDQLHAQWQHLEGQLRDLRQRLKEFADRRPAARGRGAGQAGDDPRGRAGDHRRGGQRAGGREPVRLGQGGLRLRRAGAAGAAERRARARTWGSPRRARRCCGGRWWRRPGGWSASARRGGGSMKGSRSGPVARRRSWRWRVGCCA